MVLRPRLGDTSVKHQAVCRLTSGPIDIVGDVHGHNQPLCQLLKQLGYDRKGRHAAGRRLVFVGDLCDRGPDSPAVFRLVMDVVEAGDAVCLLGNHELNLLECEPKPGNAWFFGGRTDARRDRKTFGAFQNVEPGFRKNIVEFCESLPLVIDHPDVQIVHACWDQPSLDFVTSLGRTANSDLIKACHARADAYLRRRGLTKRFPDAKDELEDRRRRKSWRANGQHNRRVTELIGDLRQGEWIQQRKDPVKVLTSGFESRAGKAEWIAGKWRFLERVPWWRTARLHKPTIFGHYWRQRAFVPRESRDQHARLFGAVEPESWLGPDRLAMCIDYRWPTEDQRSSLAAYRADMQQLVFWDGQLASRWGSAKYG